MSGSKFACVKGQNDCAGGTQRGRQEQLDRGRPAGIGYSHWGGQQLQREGATYHDVGEAVSAGHWWVGGRYAGRETFWVVQCQPYLEDFFPTFRTKRAAVASGKLSAANGIARVRACLITLTRQCNVPLKNRNAPVDIDRHDAIAHAFPDLSCRGVQSSLALVLRQIDCAKAVALIDDSVEIGQVGFLVGGGNRGNTNNVVSRLVAAAAMLSNFR